MFPYRPVQLNSRVRILIAAILAISFHAALLNLEFTQKPVWVPGVSLPRAVTVFLGPEKTRKNLKEQIPEKPVKKMTESEIPPAETKQEAPVESTAKMLIPDDKKVEIQRTPASQSTKAEKKVEAALITPLPSESENNTDESISETGNAAGDKVRESIQSSPDLTTDDDAGQQTAGVIQRAYPHYKLNAPPLYPGPARKRGQEGTVILQVLVSRKGWVDDLTIETSSGFRVLDRAAITAVKKWRFEPGRQDGKIIPMWVRVPVTFQLKK